jgi:hypothetical protein
MRSVDPGVLVLTPDGPRLIGSRCVVCGTHTFPVQDGCPRCTATSMEAVELAYRGTLWTWTIQAFPPKAPPFVGDVDPERFVPFGVGFVELPGQVKWRPARRRSGPFGSGWRCRSPSCLWRQADRADRHVRFRAHRGIGVTVWRSWGSGCTSSDAPMAFRVWTRVRSRCASPRRRRLGWEDVQFAVGGSTRPGSRLVGVEARPHWTTVHERLEQLRDRRDALFTAATAITAGTYDIGIMSASTASRAFRVDAGGRVGGVVRSERPGPLTQFGMKINRYMHEHGITGRRRWRRSAATGR